jgi:hypothetical protein
LNLYGAEALTFWARGEVGGETLEFFMGGVGYDPQTDIPFEPFTDSTPRRPSFQLFTLTTNWQRFSIDTAELNLTNIMGGFGWVASDFYNPNGAIFYLDDIQYELSCLCQAGRRDEPRFLRSFTTLGRQPDLFDANKDDDIDFVLRNTAYLYDNALALLAFLAERKPDGLRRARLIGDAMVYAATHDRTFSDGRLRTAYSAGDIALPPGWEPNGKRATVPIPGFYIEPPGAFFEVEQSATDVGNNAWAMIALLALYQGTAQPQYLETARRIGEYIIREFRNGDGLYQGFQGGLDNPESTNATKRLWASTEHNLDLYAVFTRMFQITGDAYWRTNALHARTFVEAMWNGARHCYLAGTINPNMRNTASNQLPLDTQSWSVLALENALELHPELLLCAETHHRNSADGFTGFDFNDDQDGVWFEGTAQMAVAYDFAARSRTAEELRKQLRYAGQMPLFDEAGGTPAGARDGISTGFQNAIGEPFKIFRRLHVGATAWNLFAQFGFNPYYQQYALPRLMVLPSSQPSDFQIRLYGEHLTTYRIQFSSNLRNWFNISTSTANDGMIDFSWFNGGGSQPVFFRAVSVP